MGVPQNNSGILNFCAYRQHLLKQARASCISVEEVRNFLEHLPLSRFASHWLQSKHEVPYIQPRGGYATFAKQKILTEKLNLAGADFIPLTIDSCTRHNDYERAQFLLERSEEDGRDYLNGYPLVNYGYEVTRELYRNIDKPVSLRHGTPDARLLVEIAIASGITEIEGGGLCYCLPYSTDFPLDKALLYWQYVDKLAADYSKKGRLIQRESFGPLSSTMVPPVMVLIVGILELLLAAEQGVKSFNLGFNQTGSLIQDIAIGKILREKSRQYLNMFGFTDVNTYIVYHQWMGAFPHHYGKSNCLIAISAFIANLIGVDKIITKTQDESFGIPSIEANTKAAEEVQYVLKLSSLAGDIENEWIRAEADLLASEVDSVLDTIFNMDEKELWCSVYNAVKEGIVDIPYVPHSVNKNLLLTIRDSTNSIRILREGNLPLKTQDLKLEKELLSRKQVVYKNLADKMLSDINIMI